MWILRNLSSMFLTCFHIQGILLSITNYVCLARKVLKFWLIGKPFQYKVINFVIFQTFSLNCWEHHWLGFSIDGRFVDFGFCGKR